MALRSFHPVLVVLGLGLWSLTGAGPAHAQIDPQSGIDFVTVRALGNAPWPGGGTPQTNGNIGRGSVGYEYRIGRTEVTRVHRVEFFNAALIVPAEHAVKNQPVNLHASVEKTLILSHLFVLQPTYAFFRFSLY